MKALALSGGGARLHYQVGAVQMLMGSLGTRYDIFSGVSGGALVAAYLAQFQSGMEREAADMLAETTLLLGREDVYRRWWPLGVLHGLWKKSFYSSSPLASLLNELLSTKDIQASGKKLRVGAVSLTTGRFQLFTESYPDLVQTVLASAAFPGVLEPVHMHGDLWIDGGVRVMTPIQAAIAAGATEIDVVMTRPYQPERVALEEMGNALKVMARSVDLMSEEIISKDLKLTLNYNALVRAGACLDKRVVQIRVVRPQLPLDLGTFDFDSERIPIVRAQGASDARYAVSRGAV